jgi:hypothetical protein
MWNAVVAFNGIITIPLYNTGYSVGAIRGASPVPYRPHRVYTNPIITPMNIQIILWRVWISLFVCRSTVGAYATHLLYRGVRFSNLWGLVVAHAVGAVPAVQVVGIVCVAVVVHIVGVVHETTKPSPLAKDRT